MAKQSKRAYRAPRPESSWALKVFNAERDRVAQLVQGLKAARIVCRVDEYDEWGNPDIGVDVVLHLIEGRQGPSVQYPCKPYNVNLLVVMTADACVGELSLSSYDAVLVAEHASSLVNDINCTASVEQVSCDIRQLALQLPGIVERLSLAHRRVQASRLSLAITEPTEGPLVSVLVPTFNRREFLPATLKSVREQSYSNWELILANDGGVPVDDLVEQQNDPRIRVIELPHRGKGYAVNEAFLRSRGEFVAYLDDDDIWYSDHLERLMLPLRTIPGIQMAYTDACDVVLRRGPSGAWEETKRELRYARQVTINDLVAHNHIQGIVVVHRRELFEAVGGMDPRLRVLLDWDLWRQLAARTQPYHVSRVTAEHYTRIASESESAQQITDLFARDPVRYLANRLHVLRKDLPLPAGGVLANRLAFLRQQALSNLLVVRGERHCREGHLCKARRCYQLALERTPQSLPAHRQMGLLELQQGDAAKALSHFRVVVVAPEVELADHLYACLAALEVGDSSMARQAIEQLERLPAARGDRRVQGLVSQYRRRLDQCRQAASPEHVQAAAR